MPKSLQDLLVPKHALVKLDAADRFDVVTRAIEHLCRSGALDGALKSSALATVLARERDLATGLESGLAVPHGFCAGVNQVVAALVTLKNPVDFEALDGAPTFCAVVLLEPDTAEARVGHLAILAEIAAAWTQPQVQKEVMDAESPESVVVAWSH